MAHERYTNDVLNVSTDKIPNPEVGNNAGTKGYWGYDLRALLLAHDSEFALSFNGDPNGNVQSRYAGRKLWDTANDKLWVCTTIGTIETAVWQDFAALVAEGLEYEIGAELLASALAYAIAL